MADSPAWMFTKALSHRQKVCRLYKRALRECESWFGGDLVELRYQQVIMRARFDAYRDEKDTRVAAVMLADGCRELWQKKHPKPVRFQFDQGGSSYDRERDPPDELIDYHTYTYPEREQFPYYFNRREQRKKELLEHWHAIEKAWDDEIAALQTKLPNEGNAKKKSDGETVKA